MGKFKIKKNKKNMCGQRPASVKYDYNGKLQTIKMKDVNSISKWTKGALARRRFKKLVLTKKIQALPYPVYEGNDIQYSEETLFTDKEMFIMVDYNRGGKELAWNNFQIPIGKDKFYQGQWTKDNEQP